MNSTRPKIHRNEFLERIRDAGVHIMHPMEVAGGVFARDIDRVRSIKEILDWGMKNSSW